MRGRHDDSPASLRSLLCACRKGRNCSSLSTAVGNVQLSMGGARHWSGDGVTTGHGTFGIRYRGARRTRPNLPRSMGLSGWRKARQALRVAIYPVLLRRLLDGARAIRRANPTDGFGGWHAGQDGHARQDRAGPPVTADTGDFDALAGTGARERFANLL